MGGVAIVVFSDLVDSTALLASLGDDRMDQVRRTHVEDVTGAVTAQGGRVVKTLGDGAMASFESALGALRAAAAIQAGVERLDAAHGGIGIAARVGVAAGEPIADGDDLHGMTVVIASRLSSAAGTGEVLVQDLVQALIASRDGVTLEAVDDYELKGVPDPVRASRLRWRELVPDPAGGEGMAAGGAVTDGDGVIRSSPSPRLPPLLAAYAEEPLIGRDREIGALREATASRPGRRAVLILGEPGIGKTRHAAAAAVEAHAGGATVVLARCPPEAVVPFEPWVRAIGELALAGGENRREALAAAAGPELSALVPELGGHATDTGRAGAGDTVAAEGARYRLLRGIGAALTFAAAEAPLHVVLDDAHWCDPASAQALEHLLESTSTELMLVVTARDGELGRRHPVTRVLANLRRTGDLEELRLGGLDASGLAALVGARVGRAITPQLAAQLQDRTAGNPFFAGELARDLDEQGALREGMAVAVAPVPEAVAGLVDERLTRLDPDTERLLTAVAAIGPTAPIALAAKAIDLDLSGAERAVREAISERLIEEVSAAQPTVAFPHALVREALIAGANSPTLARLHLAIARALEGDPDAEPAELARHYGLSVELTGPELALYAYRAAARAAAVGHDHEQAVAHLRSVLSLLPEADRSARAPVLLELGEQELLSADLVRGRTSFRAAIEAARETGDAVILARAALGFAGGDVGFGWEVGADDPSAVAQLWEGLEALGDSEPRLALQMIFRLAYLLIFSRDDDVFVDLPARAKELGRRLNDPEARTLVGFIRFVAELARYADPWGSRDFGEEASALLDLAVGCGREDLMFRALQWSAAAHYGGGRIPECEAAIDRAGDIARRLGSPRFTWEVDYNRAQRLLDRGDREQGEMLLHRAGTVVRRLRPDIHMVIELVWRALSEWIFDSETATLRAVHDAIQIATPRGFTFSVAAWAAALDGDLEAARERMWALLDDLESLRRPDAHLSVSLCMLAYVATLIGDREAGERLRPLLEPLRSQLVATAPAVSYGQIPEWYIGRLELLAGRSAAAVEELRVAVARADAVEVITAKAMTRTDLATALHRDDDLAGAEEMLAEAESIAERHQMDWVTRCVAEVRAEMAGVEVSVLEPTAERSRPIRAFAARAGRRALAARVRGHDDESLERSLEDPRRQRALLRAMARGFQPAQAGGFSGAIAFELEPLAIEPPPDAPWRWAIELDSAAGRARLLEPAPLETAVTIHLGLAEWARVVAGEQDAVTAMAAGRCSVEGDVVVAARLEGMFGAR